MSEAITIKNREPTTESLASIEEEAPQQSLVDWKSIWKPLSVISGVFLGDAGG